MLTMTRPSFRRLGATAGALIALVWLNPALARQDGSGSFPEYRVPGQEAAMERLRALHRLHFGVRTATTLWDPWIPWASFWPAVGESRESASAQELRAYYRQVLLTRRIDASGYVATQQHRGLAHADGWPFPTWDQAGGVGWHFSLAHDPYARDLGHKPRRDLEGWNLDGIELVRIESGQGAVLRLTRPDGTRTTPRLRLDD
jgi:hypothetical protein